MRAIKSKEKIEKYFRKKGFDIKEDKNIIKKNLISESIILSAEFALFLTASYTRAAEVGGMKLVLPSLAVITLACAGKDLLDIIKIQKYNKICSETQKGNILPE